MSLMITTRLMAEPKNTMAIEPQGEVGSDEEATLLRDRFTMVLAAIHPERIVVDLGAVPRMSEAGLTALRSGCVKAAAEDAAVEIVNLEPEVLAQLRRHGLAGPYGGTPGLDSGRVGGTANG